MTYRNVFRAVAGALLIASIALLTRGDTYAATSFALASSVSLLASLAEARDEERRAEVERRRQHLRARATVRAAPNADRGAAHQPDESTG